MPSFQLLAVELGLISTKMTKADKAEHIKRQRHSVSQTAASMQINTQPSNVSAEWFYRDYRPYFACLAPGVSAMGLGFKVQSITTDDHRLAKMAKQVKDVLPHVPQNIILKDLGRSSLLLCKMYTAYIYMVSVLCCHLWLLIVYSKNQLYWHHHNQSAGKQRRHANGSGWDVSTWTFEEQLFLCLCTNH